MKKYLVVAVALLGFASCCNLSKSVTSTLYSITYDLPADNSAVSPSLRMFWADYTNDVIDAMRRDGDIELIKRVYRPSEEFLSKYGVQKDKNSLMVSGTVSVDNKVVSADFIKQNPKYNFVFVAADVYKFKCNVVLLPELLKVEGVRYIEINQKSQLHQL